MKAETPKWSGAVQRSRLKGFTRLRAILWRRSLRLYEYWNFRSRPEVVTLRKALDKAYKAVDLDEPSRLRGQGDIFGETPLLTVWKLLDLVEQLRGDCGGDFVDLGCGRGQTCLLAALRGYEALGLEKEADWVERSNSAAESLDLKAEFLAGDLLDAAWPREGVYFVVGTAYSPEFRESILQKLEEQTTKAWLITGDWDLSSAYTQRWCGNLPVDWGIISFAVYEL